MGINMDKKSFIRGFGVGVLFTAIVLGISFTVRTSDTFIKARAKELGMIYQESDESPVLALASPEASPKETPKAKETEKKKGETKQPLAPKSTPEATPAATEAPSASPKATAGPKTDNSKKMEDEKKKMEENIRKEAQYLKIDVGDWSSDVSNKLERMGIVKSAKDFDKYLNDHGYSSTISAGTYKVSIGDTYEQLARKITKK